ncbi:MAG TPA: hypothetical protein VL137_10425 [Polyangiaceae bacterium]|nr:hypothetical protein [Polyangiaceae bacterium]
MRAVLAIVVLAASFRWAPLQCGGEPDPQVKKYETPSEALYDLATEFKTKGDTGGWRTTLEYLMRRYPNSRFAMRAKDELAAASNGASPGAAVEPAPDKR